MKTIDDVIQYISFSVNKVTIMTYIDLNWVRPVYEGDTYYFEDIDIARIELIHHLKDDMMMENSAMDIILSLLDQLYETRDQLNKVCLAIKSQPKSVQELILSSLKK